MENRQQAHSMRALVPPNGDRDKKVRDGIGRRGRRRRQTKRAGPTSNQWATSANSGYLFVKSYPKSRRHPELSPFSLLLFRMAVAVSVGANKMVQ